jgi:probable addiction module antidote protein
MMMTRKIKISELRKFDIVDYLDSDEAIAEYLSEMMDENDTGMFVAALGDVARARGMSEVAAEAGLGRESLYKALREGSEPKFDTIRRVCEALGLRLAIVPDDKDEAA